MGRWSQYDDDEHRLPEGMRRVGYDADTQIYTYQDQEGAYWEGPAGARYGQLRRVGSANDDSDDNVATYNNEFSSARDDWRYLAPFFLLICLFLLGVYTMLGGGSMLWGDGDAGHQPSPKPACLVDQRLLKVEKGQSCWSIADAQGMTVKQLEGMNGHISCSNLLAGQYICVASR